MEKRIGGKEGVIFFLHLVDLNVHFIVKSSCPKWKFCAQLNNSLPIQISNLIAV